MRLDPKDDKKLQSNLRTLLLCSQFKTIKLSAASSKFQNSQLEMLEKEENKEFLDFLRRTYDRAAKNSDSKIYIVNPTARDLTTFKIPDGVYIPDNLARIARVHQARAQRIEDINQARDEHEELRDILYAGSPSGRINARKIDLQQLKSFLKDKTHTSFFQSFGNAMLHGNQAVTLFRYRNDAKKLARDENIGNDTFFVDKINQTFSADTVLKGFNKEMKGRFVPFGAKVTAVALTAFLAFNGAVSLFHHPDKDPSIGTTDSHYAQQTEQTSSETTSAGTGQTLDDYGTTTDGGVFVPLVNTQTGPISETPAIDTYEGAASDLFNKVEEIYKYNTNGQEVNLSDLSYKNIGEASTTVLVANYNGQEYRFSTMSDMRTNRSNLERALTAAGATLTSYNTTISYLTRDEQSIAIVDGQGNPVQSGKVLQTSYGGGTEMYNQSWVNSSREMMRQNGIDPSGKSEAELIGYYLLNREPAQNPELSRALGVVSPLVHYMKQTFYYRNNGDSDPYTVQQYRVRANRITEEFNNAALGIEPQTLEGDER